MNWCGNSKFVVSTPIIYTPGAGGRFLVVLDDQGRVRDRTDELEIELRTVIKKFDTRNQFNCCVDNVAPFNLNIY